MTARVVEETDEDLTDAFAADPIAVRLDAELSRPFVVSGVRWR